MLDGFWVFEAEDMKVSMRVTRQQLTHTSISLSLVATQAI